MKKLLMLGFPFILACSNPHSQPLPTDPAELKAAAENPQFKAAVEKLPQEERELVAAYLGRVMLAKAFGADTTGSAKTIGDAITQQRKFVEDEKAKEAAAKALVDKVSAERAVAVKAMDDVLTVALTGKRVLPRDFEARRFSDVLAVEVAFQNKSTKTLSGVKGSLVFKDIFGDVIESSGVKVSETIPAGKTYVWHGSRDINEFEKDDVKLAETPQDKLKVSWEPDTYLFEDGTSLKAPSSPE